MKLEQLQQIVANVYKDTEWYVGEDDLPETLTLVEEGDWTQDHKYQYCDDVYEDDEGNFFMISHSRFGSYHTDWYYSEPDVIQVKKIEKVKVTVSWERV